MEIKGIQKLSLIDYPGELCATLFVGGCNFRCPFCYNPSLVLQPHALPTLPEEEIINFLRQRKGFLDGVCISGGEPTLYNDLPDFTRKIKDIGYLVKLDTNGLNPDRIKDLLDKRLVDYIAMDVKAPPYKYDEVAGVKVDLVKIEESIKIIKESGIPYEFRTTVVPDLLNKDDLIAIGQWLKNSKKYVLQQFLPKTCLDASFENKKPYSEDQLKEFQNMLKPYFEKCELR